MDLSTYPGEGLSLSQLVFALNEELKRMAYTPSFTLDTISRLDRDASTALATIREQRNSFTPINRIPSDVLSLVPTHLSQKDRFRATFVCRHWRRTFLQHGTLWSQLLLRKGETYANTLLERAKGSALHIVFDRGAHIDTILALLSLRARQIEYLELTDSSWAEIKRFSEIATGELPLLRTLKIASAEHYISHNGAAVPESMDPPSSPFFSNATNLEQFVFCSRRFQSLSSFVFPHLTTFELSAYPMLHSSASDLLHFLEASPMLRTVKMKIDGAIKVEGIPRESVVVLANVETFSLHMIDAWDVYDIAVYISCPYSRDTSLTYEICDYDVLPGMDIFPPPDPSNAIVNQYARSPVEEITFAIELVPDLGVEIIGDPVIGFSLAFRFSDTGNIRFGLQVTGPDASQIPLEMGSEAFSLASGCIRAHRLLSQTKCLQVKYEGGFSSTGGVLCTAKGVGALFESMGPLDKLTIGGYGLRIFLLILIGLGELEQPIVFPPTRKLIISHPSMAFGEEGFVEAVVEFAKSQHANGIPFERITVPAGALSHVTGVGLERWVGAVEFYED